MQFKKENFQRPVQKNPAANNSKEQDSLTKKPDINKVVKQPSSESKEHAEKKSNISLSLEMNAAADLTFHGIFFR